MTNSKRILWDMMRRRKIKYCGYLTRRLLLLAILREKINGKRKFGRKTTRIDNIKQCTPESNQIKNIGMFRSSNGDTTLEEDYFLTLHAPVKFYSLYICVVLERIETLYFEYFRFYQISLFSTVHSESQSQVTNNAILSKYSVRILHTKYKLSRVSNPTTRSKIMLFISISVSNLKHKMGGRRMSCIHVGFFKIVLHNI